MGRNGRRKLRGIGLLVAALMLVAAGNASAAATASWLVAPGPTLAPGVVVDYTLRVDMGTVTTGGTFSVFAENQTSGFGDAQPMTALTPACQTVTSGTGVPNGVMNCTLPNAPGVVDFPFQITTPKGYRVNWAVKAASSEFNTISSVHGITSGAPSNLALTLADPSIQSAVPVKLKISNAGPGEAQFVRLRIYDGASYVITNSVSVTRGGVTQAAVCGKVEGAFVCDIGTVPAGGSVVVTAQVAQPPDKSTIFQAELYSKGDGGANSDNFEFLTLNFSNTGGGGGGPTPSPTPGATAVPVVVKAIANRTIVKANASGVPASAQCGRACKVTVRFAIPKARAKALKIPGTTAMVTIGSGSVSRTTAGKAALTVRLTKAAKAGLKRSKTAVTVTATFTVSGPGSLTRSYAKTFKLTK